MNSWIRNVGTGSSEQDLTGADMSVTYLAIPHHTTGVSVKLNF